MTYKELQIPFLLPKDLKAVSLDELKSYAEWFLSVLAERISLLTLEVHATPGYETWKPDFSEGSLEILGNWLFERMQTLQPRSKNSEEILEGVKKWLKQGPITPVEQDHLFNHFNNWYLEEMKKRQLQTEQGGDLAMEWFEKNIKGTENTAEDEELAIMRDQWLTIAYGKIVDPLCISWSGDVGIYFGKTFYQFVKKNYHQLKWHPAFGNHTYEHYLSHLQVLESNELMMNFDPIGQVINLGFDMLDRSQDGSALHALYKKWASCVAIYAEQLPILKELAEAGIKLRSLWEFRYLENLQERQKFSQALPILCKHVKEPHDPYILEALASALTEEEISNTVAAQAALDRLARKEQLPQPTHQFLLFAAMTGGNPEQIAQAQAYKL
jgi:hypothetical protein